MASFKEVEKQVEKNLKRGKTALLQKIVDEVQPFVPVASGDLRRSVRIDETRGAATIAFGANLPYAEYQYFRNLRHLGDRGNYQSLGATPQEYRRNYEALKGSLKRSRALWFNAVLRDDSTQLRILKAFVGQQRLRRSGSTASGTQRFRRA